ncbi:hypothetical protein OIU78_023104 [Salix suchowensis]|nr:hypothetical protein OIU78_023104 [Salix suchowensis]
MQQRQLSAELKEHQKLLMAHNDEKSRDREDHKLENVRGADDHQENFRGGVKPEMVGKSRSRGQERYDRQDQMEDSDVELETNASAGDFYKESVSDLDEEKEEYREENDESDF